MLKHRLREVFEYEFELTRFDCSKNGGDIKKLQIIKNSSWLLESKKIQWWQLQQQQQNKKNVAI